MKYSFKTPGECELIHLPRNLANDLHLSPRAARVWIYLASLGTEEPVGVRRISRSTGLSTDTVNRAIQELIRLGHMEKES